MFSHLLKIKITLSVFQKSFYTLDDRILIIDDFLAMGNAILGLKSLVEQAGAKVVGAGIAVEKGFQKGGDLLRENGLKVESLAIIDSLQDGIGKV